KHPFTEQAHSAMEYIKSAKKYRTPSQLEAVKNPEDLHKLAIMDFILGNNDRHQGNIIFTKDGDIRLIDHGMTFDYGKAFSAEIPVYATRLYDDEVQVPKNVHKWLRGLDETELLKYLSHRGVPETIVSYALAKLEAAKKWSRYARGRGNTLKKLMGNLKQAHPPVSKTQVIDRISDLAETKIADPKKGSKND